MRGPEKNMEQLQDELNILDEDATIDQIMESPLFVDSATVSEYYQRHIISPQRRPKSSTLSRVSSSPLYAPFFDDKVPDAL